MHVAADSTNSERTQQNDAMNERPTPETDAKWHAGHFVSETMAREYAEKLERERDEARKHLRDANRGAQVNARINQSMAGKLNEARQQLEAMREAVVQLRDSLEVGKDSVETWDWCNTTLAKLQPFLKP